jgi:superfamily II DNA/RNA helicase
MPKKESKKELKKESKKKSNKIDIEGLSLEDPLDYQGLENNFLTNEPYSDNYKKLAEKWSDLPLYKNKEQLYNFFESIVNNQVTLVVSGTGSGKTVIIPRLLLKYFMITNKDSEDPKRFNSNIVATNPKRLSTISNAEYGASMLDVNLGTSVGYKFRGSPDNVVSDEVKLLYATDGILLAQIYGGDVLLSKYQGIIIDEAHERKIPIDLLLYFFKHVLKNRPEFKLIIMSATIDVEVFRKFYQDDGISFGDIEVSGQSNYPIESIYLRPNDKIDLFNYMYVGVNQIMKILDEGKEGDILMFVPMQKDLEIGCSMLRKMCPQKVKMSEKCNSFYCAEVSAAINDELRDLAISKDRYKSLDSNYTRKIVFATNVAESSITLDGIIYVIDTGLEFGGHFDFSKYSQIMEKKYATQSNIKQRMGRAGRTQPGICYHLYTLDKFNSLEKYPLPDIATSNLNSEMISFFKNQKFLSDTVILCSNLITPLSFVQFNSIVKYLHFYNIIKIVKLKNESNDTSEGGNDDSDDSFDITKSYEDSIEENGSTLPFKSMPYSNLANYKSYNKYQGCLTRVGNIINKLQGYNVELGLLAFYGKLLDLPMIYSLVGILSASEYKIDQLVKFPQSIKPNDRYQFINENFPDILNDNYSEHLMFYYLLTNYFELGNNLNLLNSKTFEKVAEHQNFFSKKLDKINKEDYDEINKKYNLIPSEINVDSMEMIEKVYLAIYLAYRYLSIRLSDNGSKPIYKTMNFLENNSNSITFNYGKQINEEESNNYSFGVCTGIFNGYFNCVTLIPNKYSDKFMKYFN